MAVCHSDSMGPLLIDGLLRASLTRGAVPIGIIAVALITLVAAIDWREGRWRPHLIIAVVASGVVMGVVAIVVDAADLIPYSFPTSFYAWFGIAVAAVAIAVVQWRGAPWWRRAAAVVAVVTTMLAAVALVNREYSYYPTVASLWGGGSVNQVSETVLDQMRARVQQTGQLPAKGVTVSVQIPAQQSGFRARPALAYLPPAWFASPTPELPVIVLVPGVPSEVTDWTRSGLADQAADRFAAAHAGQAPILLIVDQNGSLNADTECVDSSLGKVETYLVTDVPAYVRSRFGAGGDASSLAIGGLSAGGTCAMVVALRNADVYPTFASYSGYATPTLDSAASTLATLFGGSTDAQSAHDPAALLGSKRYSGMGAWFEVGTADADPLAAQRTLSALTVKAGIDTCTLEVAGGGHSFDVWSKGFADSLPWLAGRIGLTPPPSTTPATCTPGASP